MRLFVAIEFDDSFRKTLVDLSQKMEERAESGRFTPADNWHLTLAFLGEVAPSRLLDLEKTLDACPVSAFPIRLTRIGRFPGREGKDLVWVGVEANPEMMRLADAIRGGLRRGGFAFDPKPFVPHLTIGREIRMKQEWMGRPDPQIPQAEFLADRFCLMESIREAGRIVYRPLFVKKA